MRNKPYVLTVLGYAAYTFAVGGLAFWMPAFLERVRGIPRSEATVSFGTIVVITGFIGTFVGGWLGDYCAKYSRQAYLWLSAVATLIAAPCVWMALTTASHTVYLVCMVAAQLCMFLSTGPINAAIDQSGHRRRERATAIALSVFAIHVLGDVLSPLLIGALSDALIAGQAVKIVPLAVLIGGVVWILAARAQGRAGPGGAALLAAFHGFPRAADFVERRAQDRARRHVLDIGRQLALPVRILAIRAGHVDRHPSSPSRSSICRATSALRNAPDTGAAPARVRR